MEELLHSIDLGDDPVQPGGEGLEVLDLLVDVLLDRVHDVADAVDEAHHVAVVVQDQRVQTLDARRDVRQDRGADLLEDRLDRVAEVADVVHELDGGLAEGVRVEPQKPLLGLELRLGGQSLRLHLHGLQQLVRADPDLLRHLRQDGERRSRRQSLAHVRDETLEQRRRVLQLAVGALGHDAEALEESLHGRVHAQRHAEVLHHGGCGLGPLARLPEGVLERLQVLDRRAGALARVEQVLKLGRNLRGERRQGDRRALERERDSDDLLAHGEQRTGELAELRLINLEAELDQKLLDGG